MKQRPQITARIRAGMLLAALACAWPAGAPADEPATKATGTTTIRAGSTPRQPAPAKPAAEMTLEAYKDFDQRGPVDGSRRTPLEIPMAVGLVTCPDGNTEIGAMNVGGWRLDTAGTCEQSTGGVKVQAGAPLGPVTRTPPPASGGDSAIHCDPKTWNCKTGAP